jgi:hypothetical protein
MPHPPTIFLYDYHPVKLWELENGGEKCVCGCVSEHIDYTSFGMTIPEKSWTASGTGYRWGFQAQESDNELFGDGNASFFKYRISDNRIGRFFAVDPLAPEYPWNSPYAFSENRLIDGIELEGLEYYFFGRASYAEYVGKTSINKSWEGKVAQNIYQVRDEMFALKKLEPEKYPKLIFLQFHSNVQVMSISAGGEETIDEEWYDMAGKFWIGGLFDISADDIKKYLVNDPTLNFEKYETINALSEALNVLPIGGVAVLGGCLAGQGELAETISQLAPGRIIVMNKDFQMGFVLNSPLNPPASEHPTYGIVGFDEGWVGAVNGVKYDPSSLIGPLNIQLNSEGSPALEIVR